MEKIKQNKCIECKFVESNITKNDKHWHAYICTNEQSIFNKAILNITWKGAKQLIPTWTGCEFWVKI